MRLGNHNTRGFTLAELLVVIAIMAILIGVAVGSFTGLIGSGKSESAEYELEAVQKAVEAYMADNQTGTITARAEGSAAVITASDPDAPFAIYLRRLDPSTEYEYWWDADGTVYRVEGSGGSGSSGPTPIAEWHFDEGSGVSAADSAGTNHGTVAGGAQWVAGKSGTCLSFNTTDDDEYVIINPFSGFPTDEITVEYWMRSSDTTKDGTAFSYAVTSNYNEFLIFDYGSIFIYRGGSNVPTGISANDGAWHHIAVTWRGSDGATKLYKDGLPFYTGTLAAGTTITDGGSLIFGQEQDSVGGGFQSTQYFIGEIDEVRIFDEVLEDSEILDHYNSY